MTFLIRWKQNEVVKTERMETKKETLDRARCIRLTEADKHSFVEIYSLVGYMAMRTEIQRCELRPL